jgi:hypothetical protein
MNNKINDLISMNEVLKTSNMKITKNNNQLKTKNKKLIQKNNKLVNRERKIHQSIKARRKKLTSIKLSRAKTKLITAGTKMTPILGISAIIAATTYDIKNYCDDISEMEQFEYNLFGDKNLKSTNNKICGINIEEKLNYTGENIKNIHTKFINSMKRQYNVTEDYWKGKTKKFAKAVDKSNKEIVEYWDKFFN